MNPKWNKHLINIKKEERHWLDQLFKTCDIISQIAACSFIIVVGVCCACVGTYSSLSGIIQSYTWADTPLDSRWSSSAFIHRTQYCFVCVRTGVYKAEVLSGNFVDLYCVQVRQDYCRVPRNRRVVVVQSWLVIVVDVDDDVNGTSAGVTNSGTAKWCWGEYAAVLLWLWIHSFRKRVIISHVLQYRLII